MILSYNTLGFYSVKANRQFDNTENKYVLHHFLTNYIPAFAIVIDSTIASATYRLLDENDVEISTGSVTVTNDTNESGTAFSLLKFTGSTLVSKEDGFYYIEITYGANKLYSDIFCWMSTFDNDYVKISATTSNMSIGGFELDTTSMTYLVYLQSKKITDEYIINEEGVEKTYGDESYFNSRNHIIELEVTGYKKTYDFLSGLRVMSTNGTIYITVEDETFDVYDIEIPEKKNTYSFSDILVLSLKFKVKDYLQVRNDA